MTVRRGASAHAETPPCPPLARGEGCRFAPAPRSEKTPVENRRHNMRPIEDRRHRGVTLLEVVLAMGLLVVLSTMTYWFYSSGMETSARGMGEADKLRLARVVLDRMATEIRQSGATIADDRMGLIGDKERIWLTTVRVPSKETTRLRSNREAPAAPEFDVVQIEYKISRHPDVRHEDGYERALGLARIEKLIPRAVSASLSKATQAVPAEGEPVDQTPLGEEPQTPRLPADFSNENGSGKDRKLGSDIAWEELYAPSIRYLRFCYHDGSKWWDDWQITGENPLPQLVMVTIGFVGHPPFGEEFGQDKPNEEFCECLNKEPVDCERLTTEQFSTVVRVNGADPLFRSRVSREGQAFVQDLIGNQNANGNANANGNDNEGGN